MSSANKKIMDALRKKFPNNPNALQHFGELLCEYNDSNQRPPHLATEVETGETGKFQSCVWEAVLYRHLRNLGYSFCNSSKRAGQKGPDFCIKHDEQIIWIEAVVPAPEGVPEEYLRSPSKGEVLARSKPDQPRVLRCTSVINDKRKAFDNYRGKGIVGKNDCAVIAVNICRLSDFDHDGCGISQFPLTLEAVFPIGPIAACVTPNGLDSLGQTWRSEINKSGKSAPIPSAFFLASNFSIISAVLQGHQSGMFQKESSLAIAHNPLADNPLPVGILGAHKEFVAKNLGEEYEISNLAAL